MTHRYKLLLIDDEQDFLEGIKSYFEKRGDFAVVTALSGEEGLDKLRQQQFDVALIDLCMPNSPKSGIAVIRAIEDEGIAVSTAIITGHGDRDEAVAALNLGAQAWFDKASLNVEELYKTVKNLAQVIPEEKFAEFIAVLNEKR
ncbi:MAG: response regulator [Methylovulum sp.]|nr:response regulator [Methylovulum sp.]